MKSGTPKFKSLAYVGLIIACASSGFAATATKQATGTDLTGGTAGVWSGGSGANGSPNSADTATWSATSLGPGLTLGSSASWAAISVTGATGDIDISGAGTLTLGITTAASTALSLSGVNMTIANPVTVLANASSSGAGSTWTVASGKTITISGNLSFLPSADSVWTTAGAGGKVVLAGAANSFSSFAIVAVGGNGTLSVSSVPAAKRIQLGGGSGTGTLLYTGTGQTTTTPLQYTSSSVSSQILDQSGTGTLKFTGANTASANGNHTLQLQGSTAGVGEYAGAIGGGNVSVVNVIKTGSGTWTLSGANIYTGGTTLKQGQLNINSSTAVGAAASTLTFDGSLGAISIDNTSGGNVTLANNNPQAWNADFTFNGSTNLNLGTGAVTLGASRSVTVSANTLTVGGAISGSGFGLTKNGAGTLTLSGASSYSGPTTVANGTLTVNGSLGSGSAVTVTAAGGNANLANANLAGVGTINGTVTLNASGSFNAGINLQNSSAGTLSLASGLTLNGGNVLNFDVAGAATSDQIAVLGGVTLPASGTVTVNLNNIGVSGSATIKLISATTGTMDYTKFTLATAAPTGYSWQLANNADTHSLDLVISATAPATVYWNGAVSANWSDADSGTSYNWVTTAGGGTSSGKPGIGTAVIFSKTSPALNDSTLDAAFQIGSLVFNNPSGTTISDSGSHALTVDGNLTVNSGSGAVNVNVGSYVLNSGTGTVANNSSSALNISSPISGANTLTINSGGSGTTTLSGANSHSGTTVQNGMLALSGSGKLGGASATVSVTGGTLDLGGTSQTVGGVTVGGGTVQNGSITGTSYSVQSGTVSAALNGASATLTKSGAGTATLNGNNGYTGGTTISAGTLTIGGTGTLGGGSYAGAISDSGALNYSSSAAQTFSGALSGSGTLTMSGSSTLALSGANGSFVGSLAINSGTVLAGSTPMSTSSGSITFGGGTLKFNSSSWDASSRIAAGTSTSGVRLDINGQGTSTSQLNFGTQLNASQSGGLVISDTVGTGCLYLSGFGNAFGGNTTINGGEIQFNGDTSFGAGTLTINGGSFVPRAGSRTLSNAVLVGGNFAAMQTSLAIGANSIVLNGTVDLGGATRIVTVAQNSLTFGNAVSNGGLIKAGTGLLILSGANTFAGGVTLNAGSLYLNSSTALGATAGTFTIAGTSTIDNNSGAAITLVNNNPQAWNADFTFQGSRSLNLGTGPVTLGANRQITVNGANTLTVGGEISGSGLTLTKAGTGRLTLNGINRFLDVCNG